MMSTLAIDGYRQVYTARSKQQALLHENHLTNCTKLGRYVERCIIATS